MSVALKMPPANDTRLPLRFIGGASNSVSGISSYVTSTELSNSQSVFEDSHRDKVLARILLVYAECDAANWGGNDERAVSGPAIRDAIQFLLQLPIDMQNPDGISEPDGSLALEWRKSAFRSMILSFPGTGVAYFSSLKGPTSIIGGSFTLQSAIPLHVVREIKGVVYN